MMKRFGMSFVASIVAIGFAGASHAMLTLDFSGLGSGGGGPNGGTGETQLKIDILDGGGGLRSVQGFATFVIRNLGPTQSTITDIFFMDPELFASVSFIDNSVTGVNFSSPSALTNLPGAAPGFIPTHSFGAVDPLTNGRSFSTYGIDPGEFLTIIFELDYFATFSDVERALANQTLQIGLFVQNFPDGGTASFASRPLIIPLPAPMFAGLAGLGVLGVRRSRRQVC